MADHRQRDASSHAPDRHGRPAAHRLRDGVRSGHRGPGVILADAAAAPAAALAPPEVPVPGYLEQVYWWAYVHPNAVHVFERDWLVNTILFGNYGRLRDAALDTLGRRVEGRVLQLACAYGNMTARLRERLSPEARLEVVDILPIQLRNLGQKLPADARVVLRQGDSSALPDADDSHDQVLLFFLLHEQPEAVRRATLAEALRVVRPGGRVVIVDYHRPARWHPMRPIVRVVFDRLEPYAIDLWRHPLAHFMPARSDVRIERHRTFFGGLYQLLILTKDPA
jgi:ubiquinone/menaquinone biosynthesis C-methylase UbiE